MNKKVLSIPIQTKWSHNSRPDSLRPLLILITLLSLVSMAEASGQKPDDPFDFSIVDVAKKVEEEVGLNAVFNTLKPFGMKVASSVALIEFIEMMLEKLKPFVHALEESGVNRDVQKYDFAGLVTGIKWAALLPKGDNEKVGAILNAINRYRGTNKLCVIEAPMSGYDVPGWYYFSRDGLKKFLKGAGEPVSKKATFENLKARVKHILQSPESPKCIKAKGVVFNIEPANALVYNLFCLMDKTFATFGKFLESLSVAREELKVEDNDFIKLMNTIRSDWDPYARPIFLNNLKRITYSFPDIEVSMLEGSRPLKTIREAGTFFFALIMRDHNGKNIFGLKQGWGPSNNWQQICFQSCQDKLKTFQLILGRILVGMN